MQIIVDEEVNSDDIKESIPEALVVEPSNSDLLLSSVSKPIDRWRHLYGATQGDRVWSELLDKDSPLYAGKLEHDDKDLKRVVVDAKMAKSRSDYFKSFGVNYIGRTFLDPRNILVVENKKANKYHSPEHSKDMENLLTSLPADWWGSFSIVSSGNVDKLGDFLDAFPDTIVLAYSDSSVSKLNYIGARYARIPPPVDTQRYGIDIRQTANRLSNKLSYI